MSGLNSIVTFQTTCECYNMLQCSCYKLLRYKVIEIILLDDSSSTRSDGVCLPGSINNKYLVDVDPLPL